LSINIVFNSIIALYNLRILQKRFIADALSCANLTCGILSMVYASQGHVVVSLLFLMLGAAFDGFDGAAARRFGGTRLGVYSDDVADGVNYALAPAVALYFNLGSGVEGLVIGAFYGVFTVGRLVYFTLNKDYTDPAFFCGVPSTVGALVALSSLVLFPSHPALVGFMVGIACIQMVSFDTHYRHLGRALAANRRILYGMPLFILLLIAGSALLGKTVPVAIILGAALVYGFIPTCSQFLHAIRRRTAEPSPATNAEKPKKEAGGMDDMM
jgi:CDP-diacylglycerol---serine O-phosphatidyltransferase